MKIRTILILLFFGTALQLNAQDDADIKLLNEALNRIPSVRTHKEIKLVEQTYPCRLINGFESYYTELKQQIDSVNLLQLIDNSLDFKLTQEDWKGIKLDKVKLLNAKDVEKLQQKNRNGMIQNEEESFFYTLTLPIYNDAKTYAVIDFAGGASRQLIEGKHYLLKRIGGHWVIVATFSKWTS